MTPETKTEARERMSDDVFEHISGDDTTLPEAFDWFPNLLVEARRARRAEDALTSALSALRAEHQRVQEDSELAGALCEVLLKWAVNEGEDGESPVVTLERICQDRKDLREEAVEENRRAVGAEAELKRLRAEHQRVVAERDEIQQKIRKSSFKDLFERLQKAEKFKAYVHKRLDDAGVPVDPPSPHREQGCRIGGRLDHVFAALAEVTKERDAARAEIYEGQKAQAVLIEKSNRAVAALAASEEKARGMREALTEARAELEAHFGGPRDMDENEFGLLQLIDAALSPSPAPRVGAESESPAYAQKWWCTKHLETADPTCPNCAQVRALSAPLIPSADESRSMNEQEREGFRRMKQRIFEPAPLIPQSRAEEMVAEEREAIIEAVERLDLMQWVKTRVAAAIRARAPSHERQKKESA